MAGQQANSLPGKRKAPTIVDVASLAGVSKSTVSNVVRGASGVAEPTRLRVQQAIELLGYRPNVLARQLVRQRTTIVGVVVGDLGNPFYAEMTKLLERSAAALGYTAMFCNTEGEEAYEVVGVESLLQYRVAGIVFLAFSGRPRAVQEALESKVPVVFVSCDEDAADSVAVDNAHGGELATRHLVELGHRRIAYLTTPSVEPRTERGRLAGYRRAMEAADLGEGCVLRWAPPADEVQIDGLPARLHDLLIGAERITAVFCSNDLAAIDLLELADRVELRVPADLSVVGFDNVAMAGLARIALTTVAQPREEMAKRAIETLAGRIDGHLTGPPRRITATVELVVRGSTAPSG